VDGGAEFDITGASNTVSKQITFATPPTSRYIMILSTDNSNNPGLRVDMVGPGGGADSAISPSSDVFSPAGIGDICTTSITMTNPWWSIDFGSEKAISTVKITFGGASPGSTSLVFRVGNTAPTAYNSNTHICATESFGQDEEKSVGCSGLGRYLQINVDGAGQLNLCSVQVWEGWRIVPFQEARGSRYTSDHTYAAHDYQHNDADPYKDQITKPAALALDTVDGKVYFADWDTRKIWRMNMDGTKVEPAVFTEDRDGDISGSDHANKILSIAIDEIARVLYYLDHHHELFRVPLGANIPSASIQVLNRDEWSGNNDWVYRHADQLKTKQHSRCSKWAKDETAVQSCTFIQGDGTGGSEQNIGTATSNADCYAMVLAQQPTANGATVSTDGAYTCFAEFGMSGNNNAGAYNTCQFVTKLADACAGTHYGGLNNYHSIVLRGTGVATVANDYTDSGHMYWSEAWIGDKTRRGIYRSTADGAFITKVLSMNDDHTDDTWAKVPAMRLDKETCQLYLWDTENQGVFKYHLTEEDYHTIETKDEMIVWETGNSCMEPEGCTQTSIFRGYSEEVHLSQAKANTYMQSVGGGLSCHIHGECLLTVELMVEFGENHYVSHVMIGDTRYDVASQTFYNNTMNGAQFLESLDGVAGGCHTITDEATCLASSDARTSALNGRTLLNQPCSWCCGNDCFDDTSGHKCFASRSLCQRADRIENVMTAPSIDNCRDGGGTYYGLQPTEGDHTDLGMIRRLQYCIMDRENATGLLATEGDCTIEEARAHAEELGLEIAGDGADFGTTAANGKGFYAYDSGANAGVAYFGTGGTQAEQAAKVGTSQYRPGCTSVKNYYSYQDNTHFVAAADAPWWTTTTTGAEVCAKFGATCQQVIQSSCNVQSCTQTVSPAFGAFRDSGEERLVLCTPARTDEEWKTASCPNTGTTGEPSFVTILADIDVTEAVKEFGSKLPVTITSVGSGPYLDVDSTLYALYAKVSIKGEKKFDIANNNDQYIEFANGVTCSGDGLIHETTSYLRPDQCYEACMESHKTSTYNYAVCKFFSVTIGNKCRMYKECPMETMARPVIGSTNSYPEKYHTATYMLRATQLFYDKDANPDDTTALYHNRENADFDIDYNEDAPTESKIFYTDFKNKQIKEAHIDTSDFAEGTSPHYGDRAGAGTDTDPSSVLIDMTGYNSQGKAPLGPTPSPPPGFTPSSQALVRQPSNIELDAANGVVYFTTWDRVYRMPMNDPTLGSVELIHHPGEYSRSVGPTYGLTLVFHDSRPVSFSTGEKGYEPVGDLYYALDGTAGGLFRADLNGNFITELTYIAGTSAIKLKSTALDLASCSLFYARAANYESGVFKIGTDGRNETALTQGPDIAYSSIYKYDIQGVDGSGNVQNSEKKYFTPVGIALDQGGIDDAGNDRNYIYFTDQQQSSVSTNTGTGGMMWKQKMVQYNIEDDMTDIFKVQIAPRALLSSFLSLTLQHR
jgi:hypothetical protein